MKRKEKRGSGFTPDCEFQPRVDRWPEQNYNTKVQ
jgi:hypothetical protein